MSDKKALPRSASLLSALGVNGKTINGVAAYQHGSVMVIELSFSDSTTVFIKVKGGNLVEVGGTNEFDTGTRVL